MTTHTIRIIRYHRDAVRGAKDLPLAGLQARTKSGTIAKGAQVDLESIVEAAARGETVVVQLLTEDTAASPYDPVFEHLTQCFLSHVNMGWGRRLEQTGDVVKDEEIESFLRDALPKGIDATWAREQLYGTLRRATPPT